MRRTGGNRTGAKWTKGGSKSRNTLRLDLSGFEEIVTKLEALNGNVQKAVTDALQQAAETVHDDTVDAMRKQNMPHKGIYSTGQTVQTIVPPTVEWSGTIGIAPVGFDYGAKGAGGFLISGTPRMQPNRALEQIYSRKKYIRQLQEDMQDVISDYITEAMGG